MKNGPVKDAIDSHIKLMRDMAYTALASITWVCINMTSLQE